MAYIHKYKRVVMNWLKKMKQKIQTLTVRQSGNRKEQSMSPQLELMNPSLQ